MGLTPRRKRGEGGVMLNGYIAHTFGAVGPQYPKPRRVLQHRLVAERALGRPLKGSEEVHHWNENKADNTPANLVVCPNRAYHMLLHQRTRAHDACGHADWLRCPYCKQYDDPSEMVVIPRKGQTKGVPRTGMRWYHAQCSRDYANQRSV